MVLINVHLHPQTGIHHQFHIGLYKQNLNSEIAESELTLSSQLTDFYAVHILYYFKYASIQFPSIYKITCMHILPHAIKHSAYKI